METNKDPSPFTIMFSNIIDLVYDMITYDILVSSIIVFSVLYLIWMQSQGYKIKQLKVIFGVGIICLVGYFGFYFINVLVLSAQIIYCILEESQIEKRLFEKCKKQQTQKNKNNEDHKQKPVSNKYRNQSNKKLLHYFSLCMVSTILFLIFHYFSSVHEYQFYVLILRSVSALCFFIVQILYFHSRYYQDYYHIADQIKQSDEDPIFLKSQAEPKIFYYLSFISELLLFVIHLGITAYLFPNYFQIMFLIELPFFSVFVSQLMWSKINRNNQIPPQNYYFMKKTLNLRSFMIFHFFSGSPQIFVLLSIFSTYAMYIRYLPLRLSSHKNQKYIIYTNIPWQNIYVLLICIYLVYFQWQYSSIIMLAILFVKISKMFNQKYFYSKFHQFIANFSGKKFLKKFLIGIALFFLFSMVWRIVFSEYAEQKLQIPSFEKVNKSFQSEISQQNGKKRQQISMLEVRQNEKIHAKQIQEVEWEEKEYEQLQQRQFNELGKRGIQANESQNLQTISISMNETLYQ